MKRIFLANAVRWADPSVYVRLRADYEVIEGGLNDGSAAACDLAIVPFDPADSPFSRFCRNRCAPVIAVLPCLDINRLREAFDAGASDCVGTNCEYPVLRGRIDALLSRPAMGFCAEDDLLDGLTGFYGKEAFGRVLRDEYERAQGISLAVVMVRIDDMDAIGEKGGRSAADQVVFDVAAVLRGVIRHVDIPGRVAPDRLGIVCRRTKSQDAFPMVKRFMEALGRRSLDERIGLENKKMAVAAGIASGPSRGIATADALLRAAEVALVGTPVFPSRIVCVQEESEQCGA